MTRKKFEDLMSRARTRGDWGNTEAMAAALYGDDTPSRDREWGSKMELADAFKLALAHPKLFSHPTLVDFARAEFRTAPLFHFDDEIGKQIARMAFDLRDVHDLVPDIRLPSRSIVLSLPYKLILENICETQKEMISPDVVGSVSDDATPQLLFLCHAPNPELPIIDVYSTWIAPPKVAIQPFYFRFDCHATAETAVFADHPSVDEALYQLDNREGVTGLKTPKIYDTVRNMFQSGDLRYTERRALILLGSSLVLGSYAGGKTFPNIIPVMKDILSVISFRCVPRADPLVRKIQAEYIVGDALGTARVVLSALAILSLRNHEIVEVDTPRRKLGVIRHKNLTTPYFSESVVKLRVPETKFVRALKKIVQASRKRRHHVIGHWANKGGDRTCDHVWRIVDVNHKECPLCGRKRWWRHEHDRGDASLGWVQHVRYDVTTADDR